MKKSTKVLLALGTMVSFVCTQASAQKSCNLALTLVSPANNQQIPFTVSTDESTKVYVKFNIKNNGTADIVTTDTMFYISEFSGSLRYVTGKSIPSGSTVLVEPGFSITNAVTTETTQDYCLRLFPQGNVYYGVSNGDTAWATVTYNDADTTNDRGCASVTFKTQGSPISVNEISQSNSQQLSLYPNPANAELMFQLKLEKADKVYVSVKDIAGREVLRSDLGMVQANVVNTFKVDVQKLNSGLYIVDLVAGENKATGKVEIVH